MTAKTPYVTLVDLLVARISNVSNIGKVHNYLRNLNDPEIIKNKFFDTSNERLAAWMISRENFSDEQQTNVENLLLHPFVFHGYMAVNDAKSTELTFQQVCDDVATAFRPQDRLSNTVEILHPVQGRAINYVLFSGVLCHHAELTLQIQEYLSS